MKIDTERALQAAIHSRRIATGKKLTEVARGAGIDVSQLRRIELGKSRTTIAGYEQIAIALGWNPAAMWRSVTAPRRAA